MWNFVSMLLTFCLRTGTVTKMSNFILDKCTDFLKMNVRYWYEFSIYKICTIYFLYLNYNYKLIIL